MKSQSNSGLMYDPNFFTLPRSRLLTPSAHSLRSFDSLWNWIDQPVQSLSSQRQAYEQTRVLESNTAFKLVVDIPGVAKEDVTVEVQGQSLSLQAKRKTAAKNERLRYGAKQDRELKLEFKLPKTANIETIEASVEQGQLVVLIDKKFESAPRKIKLQ